MRLQVHSVCVGGGCCFIPTFESDNGCETSGAQRAGVFHQVIGLQTVSERNPNQITKSQHESKAVVHQVHGGQDGLLER